MSRLQRDMHGWRGILARANRRLLSAVLAAAAVGLAGAGVAQATTGTNALDKKPRFRVTVAEARPYLGSFAVSRHGKGILGSTLRNGYNGNGYLQGTISIRQISEGQPTTWLATLYEYHSEGRRMEMDLWTPDTGSRLLGHLIVRRNNKDQLVGTLIIGQQRIPVTYRARP